MNKELFLQTQILCARIELESMIAENQDRVHRGQSIAYCEDMFIKLIDKYGLGHNSVITYLQGD